MPAKPPPAKATLSRWLELIPYLVAHSPVSYAQVTAEFGITEEQLRAELERVYMCGLPGGDDYNNLIDIDFFGDEISVVASRGIERPLRLTVAEATNLLLGLHAVRAVPGIDTDAVLRAQTKIESAVASSHGSAVTATGADDDPPAAAAIRAALAAQVAVEIRYYSATSDATTDRVIDPVRIVTVDNNSYVQAWARDRAEFRLFRLDRVEAVRALAEPAAAPTEPPGEDPLAIFTDTSDLPVAQLLLDPRSAWLLEQHPMVADGDPTVDNPIAVRMRYGSPEWLVSFLLANAGRVTLAPGCLPDVSREVARRAHAALTLYPAH